MSVDLNKKIKSLPEFRQKKIQERLDQLLTEEDFWKYKKERQDAFVKYCEDNNLTAEESNRLASIFPSNATMKVLRWPKL